MIKIDEGINQLMNALKKGAKKMLRKLIIILLPIILVFILLVGIAYYIFNDDGKWDPGEPGSPSSYTGNASASTTEGIQTDKTGIVNEGLLNKGYTQEEINNMTDEEIIYAFQMEKKLEREITSLDECTEAEILWCQNDVYGRYLDTPEQLETLLKAELVTQFPKIENLPADKLNGVIEFKRISIDKNTGADKEVMLKYISSTEFETNYRQCVANGTEDILNYFTLDEEGNVVIATKIEETGEFESNNSAVNENPKIVTGHTSQTIKDTYNPQYTVATNRADLITASYTVNTLNTTKINYIDMIQPYRLPFEYLWSLLISGRSYPFVEGLAQLSYNAQIIIGIYDSEITTTTIERKDYTENLRDMYSKYEKSANQTVYKLISGGTQWTEGSYIYYDQNKIITTTATPTADIIYANTWIVEMTTQYQKSQSNEPPNDETITIQDEEWSDNGTTETISGNIKEVTTKQKRRTNQTNKKTTEATKNLYNKVTTNTREKTDKDPATDNNFVKLLLANDNARLLLTNKGTIQWLIEQLKQNEATSSMVDLTLYLLNKATDSTEFLDEEKTFDEIWDSLSTNMMLAGKDFVVNTEMSESRIVITDKTTLESIINASYTGEARKNLLSVVDTFLKIQETYNVNAIFAIAVTNIESQCGTSWNAISKHTHNWMSVTGSYNGQTYRNPNSSNPRTWRVYPSFKEATMDFGDLISNGSYYFKDNKNTVRQIAPTYCDKGWGESVVNIMTRLYSKAGITI